MFLFGCVINTLFCDQFLNLPENQTTHSSKDVSSPSIISKDRGKLKKSPGKKLLDINKKMRSRRENVLSWTPFGLN